MRVIRKLTKDEWAKLESDSCPPYAKNYTTKFGWYPGSKECYTCHSLFNMMYWINEVSGVCGSEYDHSNCFKNRLTDKYGNVLSGSNVHPPIKLEEICDEPINLEIQVVTNYYFIRKQYSNQPISFINYIETYAKFYGIQFDNYLLDCALLAFFWL